MDRKFEKGRRFPAVPPVQDSIRNPIIGGRDETSGFRLRSPEFSPRDDYFDEWSHDLIIKMLSLQIIPGEDKAKHLLQNPSLFVTFQQNQR
jgi:hypothetical protein